ncbi:MAG: hypothetical protein VZR09_08540 [Candidatus Gastranaerophilaceae bacterium]|nr:hypothetical protein [Candidatus Gastranaerophilaceae bacterium]
MKFKNTVIYLSILLLSGMNVSYSAMLNHISPADPTKKPSLNSMESIYNAPAYKAKLTQNDIHNHYEIAMQRFRQANVKSAYADFSIIVKNIVPNDYAYLRMADEMAQIGLFNLSSEAVNKSSDKEISYIRFEDIKKFYFPNNMLKAEDEIYLAEIYSNIMYNAQSREATSELVKNTELMKKSDYANYIAALGYLKAGQIKNANTYINNALKINPDNINYQKLKIEIVLQSENSKEALKVLDNIKKTKFYTEEYKQRIASLESYTYYKAVKDDVLKKYYLGEYYHSIGDNIKAVRTLQSAVTTKKKYNRMVYGLMAEIFYCQKEYEKAQNFADKSIQLGGNNYFSQLVAGKVAYRNKDYKKAVKHFKSAKMPNDNTALVWTAMAYSAMGDEKQAKEIYYKILKDNSDCSEAYYNVAQNESDRTFEYLKKAVAINLNYVDAWVGLAKFSIDKNNLPAAGKYLEIVKYIDENDFRYYYYQGLVYKAKGLHQDANYYFRKSLAINPNNELAKKELGI